MIFEHFLNDVFVWHTLTFFLKKNPPFLQNCNGYTYIVIQIKINTITAIRYNTVTQWRNHDIFLIDEIKVWSALPASS